MGATMTERIKKVASTKKTTLSFDGKLQIDKSRGYQGHSINDKKPSYYDYDNINKYSVLRETK